LRNKLVVVCAYGGWDDAFMTALMEIVADDGSYPEVLWTFNRPSTAETDGVISRLEPGLNRGRVTLYKSIDCQQFFPKLQQTWEGIDPSHQRAATRSSPVVFAVIPARPDFPSDTRMQDQEEEDRPPFVEICGGRDQDLQRLNSSDATVVFLTGLGGQGKSTIAAFYFNQSTTIAKYSTRLWRDCKEESERFENQLAAAVQTLSHGKVSAADLARQSAGSIIALLMSLIKDRSVLLVFDNVDHYVELEAEQLVGAADALIRGMLQSGTRSRVVFTCRPSVIYGHPLAMSDRLAGLTLEASYELFTQRRAPSSREEISDAHELTDGHAFWLDLLAVQVAKRAPDVSLGSLVAEIRTGGGPLPDKTLRSIWTSSAESVGCFRFRKASQRVIKGYFHSFVGTKAIGSSGHHSNLVVEAFDSTSRNLAFGAEPVQQESLVGAQHASNFLHRLQTATHGPIAPVVKKSSSPDHGFVAPEVEEGFLQLPGAGRGQLAGQ